MPLLAIIVLVLSLFLLKACVVTVPEIYHNTEVEQIISAKDLPPKISKALPKKPKRKGYTYKRKLKDGIVSYAVEYKKDGEKLVHPASAYFLVQPTRT